MKRRRILVIVGLVLLSGSAISAQFARVDDCKAHVERALKAKALHSVAKGHTDLSVYAGPNFSRLSFEAKARIADALSCVVVNGDPKLMVNIQFLDWQSGKRVAHYENGRLKPD